MTERSALGGGAGYSLIELTCAMALAGALVGISIPATRNALDEIRAAAAARDMAARIGLARLKRPGARRHLRIGSYPTEPITGSPRTPTGMAMA